jgi:peptidoglycan hydrolase CwlO-like protein
MAEESLIKEEDVLADGESGEEFLRHEEEQEQPEVVELPPNVQNLQIKMERLRGEIANLQNQFDNVRDELDTRIAAFNWFNEQLQEALNSE